MALLCVRVRLIHFLCCSLFLAACGGSSGSNCDSSSSSDCQSEGMPIIEAEPEYISYRASISPFACTTSVGQYVLDGVTILSNSSHGVDYKADPYFDSDKTNSTVKLEYSLHGHVSADLTVWQNGKRLKTITLQPTRSRSNREQIVVHEGEDAGGQYSFTPVSGGTSVTVGQLTVTTNIPCDPKAPGNCTSPPEAPTNPVCPANPLPGPTERNLVTKDVPHVRMSSTRGGSGDRSGNITFNLAQFSEQYAYLWDFGDGTSAQHNTPVVTHIFDPGFYFLTVEAEAPNGMKSRMVWDVNAMPKFSTEFYRKKVSFAMSRKNVILPHGSTSIRAEKSLEIKDEPLRFVWFDHAGWKAHSGPEVKLEYSTPGEHSISIGAIDDESFAFKKRLWISVKEPPLPACELNYRLYSPHDIIEGIIYNNSDKPKTEWGVELEFDEPVMIQGLTKLEKSSDNKYIGTEPIPPYSWVEFAIEVDGAYKIKDTGIREVSGQGCIYTTKTSQSIH